MNTLSNKIIFNNICRRIDKNKNALILAVGDTGSGKSYGCLRASQKLSPGFGMRFVEFTVEKFLDLIEQDLNKGQPIIMDEAGKGMGAREWQSKFNKIMSYILQTFRFKNYIVFFTVPDMSFVDVHARKMFHYIMEAHSIDYDKKVATFKFKRVQINRSTGDAYHKYIRYNNPDGSIKKAAYLKLKMPTPGLVQAYEEKRKQHMDEFYADLKQQVQTIKEDKAKRPPKGTPRQCPACNYTWLSRVPNPRRCPLCQKKLLLL